MRAQQHPSLMETNQKRIIHGCISLSFGSKQHSAVPKPKAQFNWDSSRFRSWSTCTHTQDSSSPLPNHPCYDHQKPPVECLNTCHQEKSTSVKLETPFDVQFWLLLRWIKNLLRAQNSQAVEEHINGKKIRCTKVYPVGKEKEKRKEN